MLSIYASRGDTVPQLLLAVADRTPERIAIVNESPTATYSELCPPTVTYGELCAAIRALAGALATAESVRRGDLVALMLERSGEMIVAAMGVAWLGAAYVPVDTDAPAARKLFILHDSKPKLLLLQERFAPAIPDGYEGRHRLVGELMARPVDPDAPPWDEPPAATADDLLCTTTTAIESARILLCRASDVPLMVSCPVRSPRV